MNEIRTIDGVETPAPGRWTIPSQRFGASSGPARIGERVVGGLLVVGDDITDSRLRLTIDAAGATSTIESRLVTADGVGDWHFVGAATIDGTERPVAVDAKYHGVFRRNGRTLTWLTIDVTSARRSWARRRRSRILAVDVNAEAPAVLPAPAA